MFNSPTAFLCLLIPFIWLCQGCVPVATGVITYHAAISAQNHSAYTDYLFATEAKNAASKRAGEPPQPILSKEKWLTTIEIPRREYAEYYDAFITKASTNSLIPFEQWSEASYQKFLTEQMLERNKFPPHQH